jgi:hypothetical protein
LPLKTRYMRRVGTRLRRAALYAALVLWAATGACGGNDLVVGGFIPPTLTPGAGTPTPVACKGIGEACVTNADCCDNFCNSVFRDCE